MTALGSRYDLAFALAHHLHRTQTRKGTQIAYLSHLMSVSALVIEHGGTEDQAIAGLLHDAAEDQGGAATLATIRQLLGDPVADIVADCTDSWVEPRPRWRERKEAYLAALPHKAAASLLVSLADKTHNAEAILADYRDLGEALWGRFNGGKEGTLWYYRGLASAFAKALPGRLSQRLSRTVTALADETERAAREKASGQSRLHLPLLHPRDVIPHLGKGEAHWVEGRSAYELATRWSALNGLPPTVRAVLDRCPDYRGAALVDGFFERSTDLRTSGRASQTDLLAILSKDGALTAVAVEGKVDESFGPLVADWLADKPESSNGRSRKPERLSSLCRTLSLDPASVGGLRYQLLHRAAAAVYEAQRYCTASALLLVHSFSPAHAGFADFQAFASRLGLPEVAVDGISDAVTCEGVRLRLGWVSDRPGT